MYSNTVKHLRESNALDLDIDALGELLDGHAGPGGLVGEPLGVLLVHVLFFLGSANLILILISLFSLS
jgi:hypothetical protein